MTTNRSKLSNEDIQSALKGLPKWAYANGVLSRQVHLTSYRQGSLWLAHIVDAAEQHDHHPDMTLTYSELDIRLSTHDAGGVTQLDFQMAAFIDEIIDDETTIKQITIP